MLVDPWWRFFEDKYPLPRNHIKFYSENGVEEGDDEIFLDGAT